MRNVRAWAVRGPEHALSEDESSVSTIPTESRESSHQHEKLASENLGNVLRIALSFRNE